MAKETISLTEPEKSIVRKALYDYGEFLGKLATKNDDAGVRTAAGKVSERKEVVEGLVDKFL